MSIKCSDDSPSDEDLVCASLKGDATAFATLIERYRNSVYQTLYYMTHNEEDALDILQDTFIRAYEGLEKLKNPAIFSTWLKRIAVNLAINHIKRSQRIRKYQEEQKDLPPKRNQTPEEIVAGKEIQGLIDQWIAQLPVKQKSTLVLCDIEGYSYKEIARILECNIGTVMSRLYYARNFLRQKLEQVEKEHGGS